MTLCERVILQKGMALALVDKRHEFRPETGAAPFEADEVFFSRTDTRGVIISGNYIFKRVAHYDWDKLLGAPHKIIRHPDMPKGVFQLFWDRLKRGEPIGAYVKNKASDGLHYWVYAMAMPFEDGYLSVRLKPSSELFKVVQAEYETLLRAEKEDGLTPAQSAAALLQRIKQLGYTDYVAFESDCLMRELAARDRNIGNPVDQSLDIFSSLMVIATELKQATTNLSLRFDAISTVPTNMRIIASRLEASGGAVSSLSQNYSSMSEEMSKWFKANVSNPDSDFATIHTTLNSCRFLFGIARILPILSQGFNKERGSLGGRDLELEKRQLNGLADQYIIKAGSDLRRVANVAEQIKSSVGVMRRFTLGLSSTRVMCNIESARLPNGGGSLVDVIRQLGLFQAEVEENLDQIEGFCLKIQENVESLGRSIKKIQGSK